MLKANHFSNKQKWAAGGLAIFAIFVLFFWGWQLKHNLENPLWAGLSKEEILNNENDFICAGGDCQIANELDLYTKDTDNDGLSDGDELNVYFTSPYLEDSDSDGYSDWEEIINNKDPNCPAGQNCYINNNDNNNVLTKNSAESDMENFVTDDLTEQLLGLSENYTNPKETELENVLTGEGDADSLRSLLLEYGMDEEFLNQISDEELLETYQEVLSTE